MKPIVGLHHVTAIVANAQRTLDFYTRVLGLRFVKRTINFDDPGSYHLYFGDDAGSPGTILTFFAWPGAESGTLGAGETASVAFSVPLASIGFWASHLAAAGVQFVQAGRRFDQVEETVLSFADIDGMKLEIVGHAEAGEAKPAREADIPAQHAIRGFFGVTLAVQALEETEKVLADMGFPRVAAEGNRYRFAADGEALGRRIDIVLAPRSTRGRTGAGTIHHIAFRAADDASQLAWRSRLAAESLDVTPVLDRTYFHSIYFREPGGVLFEIATDPPGFACDEPLESLGEALKLPEWLEPQRNLIEQRLPPLHLGKTVTEPAGATR